MQLGKYAFRADFDSANLLRVQEGPGPNVSAMYHRALQVVGMIARQHSSPDRITSCGQGVIAMAQSTKHPTGPGSTMGSAATPRYNIHTESQRTARVCRRMQPSTLTAPPLWQGDFVIMTLMNLNKQAKLYAHDFRPFFWTSTNKEWQPIG